MTETLVIALTCLPTRTVPARSVLTPTHFDIVVVHTGRQVRQRDRHRTVPSLTRVNRDTPTSSAFLSGFRRI